MTEMTPRERLLTVLKKKGTPDRVPATVHQWQAYHLREIMGVADEIDAFRMTGLDAVVYPSWHYLFEHESDDWRVTTKRVDKEDGEYTFTREIVTPEGTLTEKGAGNPYTATETEHLVKNPEDIYLIKKYWPVPVFDKEEIVLRKKALGEDGIMRTYTNGPQGSPWQDACVFCGTEQMIYHAFDRPDWVHEFLEILYEKKVEFYRKNLAPGLFEMIETGGGAASNTVISPDMFKEFCFPYDKRQHDEIHTLDPDIAISYHTCGGMMKILPLIAENGCDVSETLSPVGCGGDIRDGVDEKTVKAELGSKVLLMGGFNQVQVLTDGGKDEIYKDVARAFEGYGEGGGYIMMASDHFFHAPKENLFHYRDAVRELCAY